MRCGVSLRLLLGLALGALAQVVPGATPIDLQLIGRWCSAEVTLRRPDGTTTSSKSNASQYTVQTFSKDRVVVEWVRQPQWARWTQSYTVVSAGQLAMKMLEHSSLPSLVGSKSTYRYRTQGDVLKLISEPQQKEEPVVESTWTRCQD